MTEKVIITNINNWYAVMSIKSELVGNGIEIIQITLPHDRGLKLNKQLLVGQDALGPK